MSLLPLLLMFAIPDDPDAALGQLARYGEVPECRRELGVDPSGLGGPRLGPPRVLPPLVGKTPELVPFLEHPNRKVVLRAVALLCHSDGKEVPDEVMKVARRFPCERELVNAAVATSRADVGTVAPCREDRTPARLAPARTLKGWTAETAAARAISDGDVAAFERTRWDLDSLEATRARTAAATLAKVDTPLGILRTLRALKEPDVDPLWRGIVGAQLDALAAKRKVTRQVAWGHVVSAANVDDTKVLAAIESRFTAGERAEFEKAAEQLRRAAELTPFGRAWLEKHASSQHDWLTWRRKIDELVAHRDRPGLRAYVKDEANGLNERLEAAKALALLGDTSGLPLWDSDAGLWPEERTRRRQLLVDVSQNAPADVRAEAERLLTRSWSP